MKKSLLLLLVAMLFSFCAKAQTTALLNEGFEGDAFPPEGWTNVGTMYQGESEPDYDIYPHSGDYFAALYYTSSASNRYLITPKLTPETGDSLIFWAAAEVYYFDASTQTTTIEVSTTTSETSAFTTVLYTFQESDFEDDYLWARFAFSLDDYVGQEIYIAFHDQQNDGAGFFFDDVTGVHYEAPSCSAPSGILPLAITPTTLTLTWTAEDAASVNFYYKVAGSNTEYEVVEDAQLTENGFTIGNLTPQTTYQIYLESVCEDESTYATSVFNVITACANISAEQLPYTEDFESSSTSDAAPLCWTVLAGTSYYPSIITTAHEGSRSINLYASGATNMVALPNIDEDIHQLRMSFWLKPYSSICYGNVEIGVMSDLSDTSSFEVVRVINANDFESATWTNFKVPFNETTLEGNENYIAIRVQQTTSADWIFDDIKVEYIPSCVEPSNLEVSNITSESATFTWTPGSETQIEFTLYYKADNSTEWESVEVTINDPEDGFTTTINELTAATSYQARLEANCAQGFFSNTVNFTTECLEIDVTDENPYSQDFATNPLCWDLGGWNYNTSGYIYHSYGTYTIEALTPVFNLSEVTMPYIKFSHKQPVWSGETQAADIYVYVKTSQDGDWNLIGSYEEEFIYDEWTLDSIPVIGDNLEYVQFKVVGVDGGYYGVYFDNFMVYNNENVSCVPAMMLNVSNVTSSSVELSWSSTTESTIVYYREVGTETWNQANVTGTSTTLTDLEPSTNYEWYVAVSCPDGEAQPSTICTFATPCEAISVATEPYVQNFDETAIQAIPSCWTNISTFTYSGYYGTEIFPAVNNTYGDQYTASSPNLMIAAFGGPIAIIALPQFTENLNTLRLSFDTKVANAGSAPLEIGYLPSTASSAADFQPLTTLSVSEYFAYYDTETPGEFAVNFDTLTSVQNGVIAFRVNSSTVSNSCQWHLDNLMVQLIPSCETPINLTSSNITENSVDLSWSSDAPSFSVFYKTADADTYNEVENVTLTNGIYTLSGLQDDTHYDWYVVANCTSTDISMPSSVRAFKTSCGTVAVFPYTESFEAGLGCWVSEIVTGTRHWSVIENNTYVTASDGTHCALFPYTLGASARLISPVFDLSEVENPVLTYDYYVIMYGGLYDSMGVYYRTSENAEWVNISSHNNNGGNTTFGTYALELPNTNSTYQVMFLGVGLDANSQMLDRIRVIDSAMVTPVVCNAPTGLAVNGQTQTTANVSWNANGATAWKLQYKLASATAWGNEIEVNTNPAYQITGLTAATDYQVRVKAVCDENTESEWTSAVAFGTLPEDVEPCNAPTNVTVSDFNNNSITVTWDANGASAWNVQYRVKGASAWTTGGSNITAPTYTITDLEEATIYQIQVQAVCDGTTSDWSAMLEQTTGIDNRLMNSISLYPNPANDYVDVRVSDNDVRVSRLEVYDVYGKLLNEVEVINNPTRINVSSLANGMYYVRVITESGVATKNFIKK